jgi:multidrug resistance efflux pump
MATAVAIGSQLAGVVTRVHVHIDQEVKAGDMLFELDKRQATADLKVRQAALSAAREQLRRLELQPRPEEVPAAEAQVALAEANERQQRDIHARDRKIEYGAMSEEDRVVHEQTWRLAQAQLAYARANLALLKAGAWEPDKAITRAQVEQARAQVEQSQTNLDSLDIRAPVDGTILQVNVRAGEYVTTFAGQSLILMGNLHPLHVRVSVDEDDVVRLRLNMPARARVRGDPASTDVPRHFVRLEPYIVPKVSLTGINVERVDTRVVQLIYALDPKHPLAEARRILVGQLVDVFIDTDPSSRSPGESAEGNR